MNEARPRFPRLWNILRASIFGSAMLLACCGRDSASTVAAPNPTTLPVTFLNVEDLTPQQARNELLARTKPEDVAKAFKKWLANDPKNIAMRRLLIAHENSWKADTASKRLFATAEAVSAQQPFEPVLNPDQQAYLDELANHVSAPPDPRLQHVTTSDLRLRQFFNTAQIIDGVPPIDAKPLTPGLPPDSLSCVALIATSDEVGPAINGRCAILSVRTFAEKRGLCPDVPHAGTSVIGFGTAFLVRSNRICTAGHNLDDVPAGSWRIIFGYRYDLSGNAPTDVSASDVFSISRAQNFHVQGQMDYGIAELDRSVDASKYIIATCNTIDAVPPGGQGFMVHLAGHPEGLPLSSSQPGQVLKIQGDFFVAPLTEYPGNSGSPVFGPGNTVLGILSDDINTAHHQQYDYSGPANCGRPMEYASNSTVGEYCMRMSFVVPHLDDQLLPVSP